MTFFPPQKRRKENHDGILSKLGILLLFKRSEVMNPKNRPDPQGSVPVFNNCSTLLVNNDERVFDFSDTRWLWFQRTTSNLVLGFEQSK